MNSRNGVVNVILKRNVNSSEPPFQTNSSGSDPEKLGTKHGPNLNVSFQSTQSGIPSTPSVGSELIDRTEALIKKLAKKDQEIENLCVLLECLEPIPGISAESIRKHLDNSSEDDADFRDSKIVALAKKNRNLMVSLNKERASADSRGQQIQDLTDRLQRVEKIGTALKKEEPQGDTVSLRKEISSLNKTTEDLKRKVFHATEENKKLARALANEVGDSVTVDQAVEGSWRGRAQQIIMLKAKIKKLTDENGGATLTPFGTNFPKMKRIDVDSKAQEELVDMSLDRKHAVESIIEERDSLIKVTQSLEEKVLAHKARIRNLEAEAARQKQQLKIVLDVKGGDDVLIEALQQEVLRFKMESRTKSVTATAAARTSGSALGTAAEMESAAADLVRLRRLCKSQADQLTTQDGVIRSLRSRLSSS